METVRPEIEKLREAYLQFYEALVSLRGLLWHTEQKLWNRPLVGAIESALSERPRTAAIVCRSVVEVDSLLFVVRVLVRKAQTLGPLSLLVPRAALAMDVLHIDCGVHEEGREIRSMLRWFPPPWRVRVLAFEAGRRQYLAAKESLRDIPNLDLRHGALVGPDYTAPTVEFYNWAFLPNGEGDSLFSTRGGSSSENVPAIRLSHVLRTSYASHRGPIILRMNIEGAETFVIQDLADAELLDSIDGFHGSWDDLSFIDPAEADRFRALLRRRRITPLSFNGRDLGHALRRIAIRLDVGTSLANGAARQREAPPPVPM